MSELFRFLYGVIKAFIRLFSRLYGLAAVYNVRYKRYRDSPQKREAISNQYPYNTLSQTAHPVEDVLSGKESIVSHPDASQFWGGIGATGCGFAGLNFVRIVLARVEAGFTDDRLLAEIFERKTSEEITSICTRWPNNVNLEVEDIFKVPLFERALNLVSSTYGKPSFTRFLAALSELQSLPSEYAAIFISRPPEIITCLKLPIRSASGKQDVFIIFDARPRSSHPQGARLIVNTSIEGTAAHLDNLLWQTQLLANFTGHFFVPKWSGTGSIKERTQPVLAPSLVMRTMQTEVKDLKFQVSSLGQALETQKDERRGNYESMKKAHPRSVVDSPSTLRFVRGSHPEEQAQRNALKRFSSASNLINKLFKPSKPQGTAPKNVLQAQSAREAQDYLLAQQLQMEMDVHGHSSAHSPSTLRSIRGSHPEEQAQRNALKRFSSASNLVSKLFKPSKPQGTAPKNVLQAQSTRKAQEYLLAQQLQMEMDVHEHSNTQAGPSSPREQATSIDNWDQHANDYTLAIQLQRDWECEDALPAQVKQSQWEQEDARLAGELVALQMQEQVVFECGVCFDRFPEDNVAIIASCPHEFCRGCLKTYVESKLADKVYPIYCPVCLTDRSVVEPGMITDDLSQMLGLADKEYRILQELQIAPLSIMIHCQQCKGSVFVDRAEYEEAEIIACPLPRCSYTWCKACQQAVVMNGPKHSCDGSAELDRLMKERGWKHCPGCKTPFQKSSGCNHMTCMAPGCHTHFCYVCGELIVRSAMQRDVSAAVSAHYRRCRLFEDVAGR